MIKLIASDMDGTLLNDNKEFPPDFFEVLDALSKKNIHFAAASGRSFSTLKINFSSCLDNMDFICDNGAFVVIGGKVESMSIIEPQRVAEILELCCGAEGVVPVLCGVNGIYFENYRGAMNAEVGRFYLKYTCVDNIRDVKDDIFKVAVYDPDNVERHIYPVISERFGSTLNVAVTGEHWLDMMNIGINKGRGLEMIQRKLGITPAETMTFGDYFNDVELLGASEYSFVMANAHKDMFRYGKYIAESNNNFGVTKAIKKYAL